MLTTIQHRAMVRVARDRIVNFPQAHHQGMWLHIGAAWGGDREQISDDELVADMLVVGTDIEAWAACGTTACVAGHLVAAAIELGYLEPATMIRTQEDICSAAQDLLEGHDPPYNLFWANQNRGFILDWMNQIVGDEATP